MRTERLRLVAVLVVLAVALPGLRPNAPLIGVSIQGNRSNDFYKQLQHALQRNARTYSYRVVIQHADEDPAKQQQQIEDFITERVDAIVVVPVDSQEIDPAILEANVAHIPVFTVDIGSRPGEGSVVASITSDNRSGGFDAGSELCAATPPGADIAVLDEHDITSVQDRVNGFTTAIKECRDSSPNSTPLGVYAGREPAVDVKKTLSHGANRHLIDVDVGREPDTAADALTTILNERPHLRGVFAINDTLALGAVHALFREGRQPKDVPIVGYDDTPAARGELRAGNIRAEIAQDPACLGAVAIQQIHRTLTSRSRFSLPVTPASIEVPVAVDDSGMGTPARVVESFDTQQEHVAYPGCDNQ